MLFAYFEAARTHGASETRFQVRYSPEPLAIFFECLAFHRLSFCSCAHLFWRRKAFLFLLNRKLFPHRRRVALPVIDDDSSQAFFHQHRESTR